MKLFLYLGILTLIACGNGTPNETSNSSMLSQSSSSIYDTLPGWEYLPEFVDRDTLSTVFGLIKHKGFIVAFVEGNESINTPPTFYKKEITGSQWRDSK